jgi:hypothetical protein
MLHRLSLRGNDKGRFLGQKKMIPDGNCDLLQTQMWAHLNEYRLYKAMVVIFCYCNIKIKEIFFWFQRFR